MTAVTELKQVYINHKPEWELCEVCRIAGGPTSTLNDSQTSMSFFLHIFSHFLSFSFIFFHFLVFQKELNSLLFFLTLIASESEKSETPPINVLQKEASARRTLLNEKKRESSLSEKQKATRTGSDPGLAEKRASSRRTKDSSEEKK